MVATAEQWGPVLAAAAREVELAVEYAGAADPPPSEPLAAVATAAGSVLWAVTDAAALAGRLQPWLLAAASALGLLGAEPAEPSVPPPGAAGLAFATSDGGSVKLWIAPGVLPAEQEPAPPDLPSLGEHLARNGAAGIDLLLDVPMQLSVELGRTERRIRDILAMAPGSIVELNRLAGEPVDLLVNGRLIAHAEVVVVDENFAVRITDIISATERINRLRERP